MTPDPHPDPKACAEELEVAAKIADDHSDHRFAKMLRERARELQEEQEKKP